MLRSFSSSSLSSSVGLAWPSITVNISGRCMLTTTFLCQSPQLSGSSPVKHLHDVSYLVDKVAVDVVDARGALYVFHR